MNLSNLKEKYGYFLRYSVLSANDIINLVSPASFCATDFTGDTKETAYEAVVECRNRHDNFYSILENDILKYGVENPLLVYAGKVYDHLIPKLHPDIRNKPSEILACVHGGSRLYIAQKYSLMVPCVIVDWIDRFVDAKLLVTDAELLRLYKKPPPKYRINHAGLHYTSLPYHHLER